MKRSVLIIVFFKIYFSCFSQTNINLTVFEGSRVEFNFDSYNDIVNGRTLGTPPNGFTRIQIKYKQDVDFSSNGWVLTVRSNDANLYPDFGSDALDLSSINLYTYLDGIYQSTITLSSANQVIATKNISYPPVAALPESHINEITIVYDCGKSGELFGFDDEEFRTDLIFNVQSQ